MIKDTEPGITTAHLPQARLKTKYYAAYLSASDFQSKVLVEKNGEEQECHFLTKITTSEHTEHC